MIFLGVVLRPLSTTEALKHGEKELNSTETIQEKQLVIPGATRSPYVPAASLEAGISRCSKKRYLEKDSWLNWMILSVPQRLRGGLAYFSDMAGTWFSPTCCRHIA
jgi:hypothetical protein